ncbi:hypothetical protein AVEN_255882-1 [Araneus ventricosus]|uniref:Uncharacterized protein n=1 Tax=Araneus ventricosus TaxID=182803 RepID=A0A4Y2DDE0_ARAVE|nr:hypothetical protein AVEN_255882-1 [Araneus ventricosus]
MDQEGVVRVDLMPHVDEDIKAIIYYFEAYKSYINKLLANNNETEGMAARSEDLKVLKSNQNPFDNSNLKAFEGHS